MSESNQVIVAVGRAVDISTFVSIIQSFLFDNFSLVIANPLEEDAGFDGKVRCIGFVVGKEVPGLTFNDQATNIKSTGIYQAIVCDSMDKAVEIATKNYGFESGEMDVRQRAERVKDVIERFRPFDSEEIEFFSMFDSLMLTGKISLIRGIYEDEQVMMLGLKTESEDGSEMKISVMAMMLHTPELRQMIETPYMSLGG